MKAIKLLPVLFFSLIFSVAANAQFKSANLTAAGLTCAMCTRAINTALEKLPFVQSVNPNIKTSSFEISFKEGKDVNFDKIKTAVEEAGFSVSRLAVNTDFKNVVVKKDKHIQLGGKTFHFLKAPGSTLNGQQMIVIVDKNFVTAKDFKKYAAATTMACVQTGKAASCCSESGAGAGTRVYHVTI